MAKKKVDYAKWKKVLWRFGRIFLAAFLTTLALTIGDLETLDINNLWPVVVYPAIVAGINALFKALREKIGDGDYSKLIYKLPL